MSEVSETDRIVKKIEISRPRARVWRAISDYREFGAWFGVKLAGPFEAGQTVVGQITYPGYEHLKAELQVVELIPERYFAYRWRPNAVDPKQDYSGEPTTLVEFSLEETGAGSTLLTIVESGFDRIPEARRAQAFRANDGGWSAQIKNIERHVTSS